MVNEGDLISINIPEGRLDIMISQQELKERLENGRRLNQKLSMDIWEDTQGWSLQPAQVRC